MCSPFSVHAQDSEEDVAGLARASYNLGIELYKNGDFDKAARAFRQANRLRPSWKIHYNIGQCEAAAKRYPET